MNNRILISSALALSLLSTASAWAGEPVLVLHDEGNSGPTLVQAVPVTAAASQPGNQPVLVLHDDGNSGPALVPADSAAIASGHQQNAAPSVHAQVQLRDSGMSAPRVFIR